jgi:hypothetical protein
VEALATARHSGCTNYGNPTYVPVALRAEQMTSISPAKLRRSRASLSKSSRFFGCQLGEEFAVFGFREQPLELALQVFHGAQLPPQ